MWFFKCKGRKVFLVLGHIENAGNASPKLIVSQSLHTDNIVLLDIQKITLDMIQVIMAPSLENSLTRASYSPRSKIFSRLLKKWIIKWTCCLKVMRSTSSSSDMQDVADMANISVTKIKQIQEWFIFIVMLQFESKTFNDIFLHFLSY